LLSILLLLAVAQALAFAMLSLAYLLLLHSDFAVPGNCLRSTVGVCVHNDAGVPTVAEGSAFNSSCLRLFFIVCVHVGRWRTWCCLELLAFLLFACAPVVAGIPSLESVPAADGYGVLLGPAYTGILLMLTSLLLLC
jgi:hypothetical protein